jgi:sugar O-acyltransferase (sialic acid O-acetyltransferase NeuD family)
VGVLIETPRINANEDQLQVIEIRVAQGELVAEGDTLFVLETTKAAVEVNAPVAGVIKILSAKIGDFVDVGRVICEIGDEISAGGHTRVLPLSNGNVETRITAKARKLAESLGIDLATVQAENGRIGEAQIVAAANRKPPAARAEKPAASVLSGAHNSRRAVIIGGGGHAACLIDALQGAGYQLLGCTDQNIPVGHCVCAGITVIGKDDCLEQLFADGVRDAFIGVGGAISSETRRRVFERATAIGFRIPSIIHPRAIVSANASIGEGCHVLAGATIGPRCAVGNNVIVNQGSILCHDSVVHDHAHLAPGSILAGDVKVGMMTVIGMGVTVMMQVHIGSNVLIHNGAHITNDVADDMIVDSHGKRYTREKK